MDQAADFKDEKSADVLTLIDSDDDNDIDTVYVKTYTVGKVTYASSSSIIVNGKTYKYDDENIADGIKKDDWAIITENLFDDCKDIVKADMATTKVEATKNQGKDPSATRFSSSWTAPGMSFLTLLLLTSRTMLSPV